MLIPQFNRNGPGFATGFGTPDYSSIHTVRNAVPQQHTGMGTGISVPTSTPKFEGGSHFDISDPTHKIGKSHIIDSFAGI